MRGHRDGGHTGVKRKGLINLSITSSLFIHPRFDFFFFFFFVWVFFFFYVHLGF